MPSVPFIESFGKTREIVIPENSAICNVNKKGAANITRKFSVRLARELRFERGAISIKRCLHKDAFLDNEIIHALLIQASAPNFGGIIPVSIFYNQSLEPRYTLPNYHPDGYECNDSAIPTFIIKAQERLNTWVFKPGLINLEEFSFAAT